MKKWILCASAVLPNLAYAIGCYVDYSNPTTCRLSPIICFASSSTNYYEHGGIVGSLCDSWLTSKSDAETCYSTLNDCSNAYNSEKQQRESFANALNNCDSAYNSAIAQQNTLSAWLSACDAGYLKQKGLVKKLKKACGARCKRIK